MDIGKLTRTQDQLTMKSLVNSVYTEMQSIIKQRVILADMINLHHFIIYLFL